MTPPAFGWRAFFIQVTSRQHAAWSHLKNRDDGLNLLLWDYFKSQLGLQVQWGALTVTSQVRVVARSTRHPSHMFPQVNIVPDVLPYKECIGAQCLGSLL